MIFLQEKNEGRKMGVTPSSSWSVPLPHPHVPTHACVCRHAHTHAHTHALWNVALPHLSLTVLCPQHLECCLVLGDSQRKYFSNE